MFSSPLRCENMAASCRRQPLHGRLPNRTPWKPALPLFVCTVQGTRQACRAGAAAGAANLAVQLCRVRFSAVLCRAPTKRVVGNMAALSGAQGISYMEYSTQQRRVLGLLMSLASWLGSSLSAAALLGIWCLTEVQLAPATCGLVLALTRSGWAAALHDAPWVATSTAQLPSD